MWYASLGARDRGEEIAVERGRDDAAGLPEVADVVAVEHQIERRGVIEVRVAEHDVIEGAPAIRPRRAGRDAEIIAWTGRARQARYATTRSGRSSRSLVPASSSSAKSGAADEDRQPGADVDQVDLVRAGRRGGGIAAAVSTRR